MLKAIFGLIILGNISVIAGPFFKESNQLEIRKYRFSRHTNKGFERLVLEFDHLGSEGAKPGLKVEPTNGNETKVTLSDTHLSGIIPESEINRSYLTRSKYLGPVTIAAEKGTFHLIANLKKSSSVEAFWLDKPARLVVDVFAGARTAATFPDRKIASKKARPLKNNNNEVYCFPETSQMQPLVEFEAPTPEEGDGAATPAKGRAVVCFPASSRLIPQISFRQNSQAYVPPVAALSTPSGIQTDLVGGSQKAGDPFATSPIVETAPPISPLIEAAPASEPISETLPAHAPEAAALPPAVDSTVGLSPPQALDNTAGISQPTGLETPPLGERIPSSVTPPAAPAPAQGLKDGENMPAIDAALPVTPSEIVAPALLPTAENVQPDAAQPEEATPFPKKKKKKKKSKPRLPQLPQSITEGALLPPVK